MTFDDLYREHARRIRRLAFSYLHDEHRAEDACQEVLTRAYQQLPPTDWINAWPWLSRVTKNLCIDQLRASRETPSEDQQIPAQDLSPEDLYLQSVKDELVRVALDRIPGEHRRVLKLFFWKGLSHRDIGVATGSSPTSVNNRMHYAKKLLAIELRKLGLPSLWAWLFWRLRRFNRPAALAVASVAVTLVTLAPPVPIQLEAIPAFSPPRPVTPVTESASSFPGRPEVAPPVSEETRASQKPQRWMQLTESISIQPQIEPTKERTVVQIGPVYLECSEPRELVVSHLCDVAD